MRYEDYFFYPEPEIEEEMGMVCPQCGGPVVGSLGCHTWPQRSADGKEVWMSCISCSSAIDWGCDAETEGMLNGCGWNYTEGLSRGNPRSAENDARKPDWIPTYMYRNLP